jgi:pentatricopeptide repeat protein
MNVRKRPRSIEQNSFGYGPFNCIVRCFTVFMAIQRGSSLTCRFRKEQLLKKNAILHEAMNDNVNEVSSLLLNTLLHISNESLQSFNYLDSHVTSSGFNVILQNFVADGKVQLAEDTLKLMENQYRKASDQSKIKTLSSDYIAKPDVTCYNTVIHGWVNSDHPHAAGKAQSLLDHLESMYDKTGDDDLEPNETSYMLVCRAWAEDDLEKTKDSALHAEDIIHRMSQRGMPPNKWVFTSVINAWCQRSGIIRGAMERAEAILKEMERLGAALDILSEFDVEDNLQQQAVDSIRPNVITYTAVISGLARSREHNLARRAEAIIKRMVNNGVEPDMVAYTALLMAWSKSKSHKERRMAASRALCILQEMEQKYIEHKSYCKPSALSYTTAISAIGNSLDANAAELAERVIRHMYTLHEDGKITGIYPTTITYNAVISAIARMKDPRNKSKHAEQAQRLLTEMIRRSQEGEKCVEPNEKTWGGVMLAWATSGVSNAPQNAEKLLEVMEEMYRSGKSTVRPNTICMTTVMRAWSNSRHDDALDRAEAILKRMEEEYEKSGDEAVKPNAISYVTLIDAFARRDPNGAARRAQATVDRMIRLYAKGLGHARPSRIVFNTLVNCWSRSNDPDAGIKAERILQWMEAQYEAGDEYVKPDEITFCNVLNAWANNARNGGAERSQQILDHMQSLSNEERGFRQSVISYNIVIKAWGRSGRFDAVQKAESLLKYLENQTEIHPDTTTYSSVINCCAYYDGPEEGRQEALEVALRTFQKLSLSPHAQPNQITFGTLFKAVNKLMPKLKDEDLIAREDLLRTLFGKCISVGQVDGFVLAQLRNACSVGLYEELVLTPVFGEGSRVIEETKILTILEQMPKAWNRNLID